MDTIKASDTDRRQRFENYDCSAGCPVEAALEVIGGKWKGLIIYHLLSGTLRFGELKKRLGNVTQRTLTKQLRELENDGLVKREVYAVVPPKVEYSLTESGSTLAPIIQGLRQWGMENVMGASEKRAESRSHADFPRM